MSAENSFITWAKRQGFTQQDLNGPLHELQGAFEAGAAQCAMPAEFDVRTILLDVVPGDGSGIEVYAKNVDDVVRKLTELSEREDCSPAQVDLPTAGLDPLRFIRHALKLADRLPDSEIAYTLRLYLNGVAPLTAPLTAKCGIAGMLKTTCPYCEQGFAFDCPTCSGHGLVGGHMPDGSGHGEPCPDCNAPA